MTPAILAALALLAQEDGFEKRVRTEPGRVLVDDTVVYEGPWSKAGVTVEEFAANDDPDVVPWKQVVVRIDGEERVRVPVPSLDAPIAWPPLRKEELRPVLKKLTQSTGDVDTLSLFVVTERDRHLIYRGPPAPTRIERTVGAFSVILADRVLYRVTGSRRPKARPEDVLEAVNRHRRRAGVPGVTLSPELSKACDLHALYMVKNEPEGLDGHEEDPDGIGYTPEGAKAGERSVISAFAAHESPADAFESLMATLYHRVSVLHPGVSEIGVGWAYRKDGPGHLVVDVGSRGRPVDPDRWPVVYPGPGQEGVPLEFALGSRETPDPLPPGVRSAGYPVTVMYPPGATPRDPRPRLLADGKEIPCWVSTPQAPAREDWPQPGVVCLIPKSKLRPGTTYVVRVGDREWFFNTAK